MPLAKSPILNPAKLAANRSNASRSTGPRRTADKRRVRLNGSCAWWYADEATYAIWRALPPSPRCPLVSVDSSGDSTLLRFPVWAAELVTAWVGSRGKRAKDAWRETPWKLASPIRVRAVFRAC